MAAERVELDVDGRTVSMSNPQRVYFSARGETKLDLANYYIAVGDGILNALRERPTMLHRFPDGVDGTTSASSLAERAGEHISRTTDLPDSRRPAARSIRVGQPRSVSSPGTSPGSSRAR